jgi:hypothetical protein
MRPTKTPRTAEELSLSIRIGLAGAPGGLFTRSISKPTISTS